MGALLGDRTRAGVLDALLDGRAHTVGELARHTGVSASTASEHLGRLLDGGLVAVEAQGRHRYYRLAGREVAELLESLLLPASLLVPTAPCAARAVRPPAALAFARTCYDHLAGALAVSLHDHLLATGVLAADDRGLLLTDAGATAFSALDIDVDGLRGRSRPLLRTCLDWTERRHHLAGGLGAALLDALLERCWVVRQPGSRAVRLTLAGASGLSDHFGYRGP